MTSPEPPKGQHKGPINWKGPRAYVDCGPCTVIFKRPMGISKQHFREHLRAHKKGLIKKVKEPKVTKK